LINFFSRVVSVHAYSQIVIFFIVLLAAVITSSYKNLFGIEHEGQIEGANLFEAEGNYAKAIVAAADAYARGKDDTW
jgi:uncharacterized protein (UPF0333 family)